jgi:cyclic pyranopterin phosphate synthase
MVNDALSRPLASLRVSLTDRCNLRCRYCMPEEEYVWLPRASILTFEEIARLAGVFTGLGASKVRLTGGEPLLRHDVPTLVALLRRNERIADLALTTNGMVLAAQAAALRRAGLHRLTVSLDTLRPDRFEAYTKSKRHGDVLEGIAEARRAGFERLKLNTVVVKGYNQDELGELIEFGRGADAEVRFIEYMDVGGATRWSPDQVVSRHEMLEALERRYGRIEPVAATAAGSAPGAAAPAEPAGHDGGVLRAARNVASEATAPAERFVLADGTTFGIIASTTAPFCRTCDRSRLTADGTWLLCLYAERGVSLRDPLRQGATDEELRELIAETWQGRRDRGAEERLRVLERGALYPVEKLRQDPHREMHTRGG